MGAIEIPFIIFGFGFLFVLFAVIVIIIIIIPRPVISSKDKGQIHYVHNNLALLAAFGLTSLHLVTPAFRAGLLK